MTDITRRDTLKILAAGSIAATAGGVGCAADPSVGRTESNMSNTSQDPHVESASNEAGAHHPVLRREPLGFMWPTIDPFLFCVHHHDAYPAGNAALGPDAPLTGRRMGNDFTPLDGWRMYHGRVVPGFPQHPHRGFETVTVTRTGLVDHSDSMGAGARFGQGDVQWLTAGAGIQHAEMFPLIRKNGPNPTEFFQIWLNLPAAQKMVDPYFTMFWNEDIEAHTTRDEEGRATTVRVIAGEYGDARVPTPPPNSWASSEVGDVAIWTLRMEPGARFTLPAAAGAETRRALYLHVGSGLTLAGQAHAADQMLEVLAGVELELVNGEAHTEILMLQGKPIDEPVARHGPFVMNTPEQIHQAYADYRRTRFGGWPWDREDPVHGEADARFARHADGRVERPG